ncbi:MAG: hypothetical protein R3E68_21875 [Burkholderiaceae bacterium]
MTQDFGLLRQAMTPGLADTAADIAITFIGRLARVPTAWRPTSRPSTRWAGSFRT